MIFSLRFHQTHLSPLAHWRFFRLSHKKEIKGAYIDFASESLIIERRRMKDLELLCRMRRQTCTDINFNSFTLASPKLL